MRKNRFFIAGFAVLVLVTAAFIGCKITAPTTSIAGTWTNGQKKFVFYNNDSFMLQNGSSTITGGAFTYDGTKLALTTGSGSYTANVAADSAKLTFSAWTAVDGATAINGVNGDWKYSGTAVLYNPIVDTWISDGGNAIKLDAGGNFSLWIGTTDTSGSAAVVTTYTFTQGTLTISYQGQTFTATPVITGDTMAISNATGAMAGYFDGNWTRQGALNAVTIAQLMGTWTKGGLTMTIGEDGTCDNTGIGVTMTATFDGQTFGLTGGITCDESFDGNTTLTLSHFSGPSNAGALKTVLEGDWTKYVVSIADLAATWKPKTATTGKNMTISSVGIFTTAWNSVSGMIASYDGKTLTIGGGVTFDAVLSSDKNTLTLSNCSVPAWNAFNGTWTKS
jgi:hypothetical protein